MPARALIDVDGTDAVSKVILTLLNEFPGLNQSQHILFATVDEASGIGFYPTSGAAYLRDTESITGHVTQACLYPFSVVYRAAPKSEKQRMRIKEFLDTLGKWLEKQPVTIGDTTYQLDAYPALSSGNRVIKSISRSTPAFLNAAYQDAVEDWAISIRLIYENEFDR